MGPPNFWIFMWMQLGQHAGLTRIGFLRGVSMRRAHCEWRHPVGEMSTDMPCHDTERLTNGMRVPRREQTVGPQAVHRTRRDRNEVGALGVVASVDDLEGGEREEMGHDRERTL